MHPNEDAVSLGNAMRYGMFAKLVYNIHNSYMAIFWVFSL